MANECSLTAATYNIHRFRGLDGRRNVDRTLRVLAELEADIIGLQEVVFPEEVSRRWSLGDLAETTGKHLVLGPTLLRHDGRYGNALLSSYPVTSERKIDITVEGREPRGALEVALDTGCGELRVIVTHLGLNGSEREYQIQTLLHAVGEASGEIVILMGDFNVLRATNPVLQRVEHLMGKAPALRTFPACCPFLRLDRIWVRPEANLVELSVHRSLKARFASDHLPVKALLNLNARNPE